MEKVNRLFVERPWLHEPVSIFVDSSTKMLWLCPAIPDEDGAYEWVFLADLCVSETQHSEPDSELDAAARDLGMDVSPLPLPPPLAPPPSAVLGDCFAMEESNPFFHPCLRDSTEGLTGNGATSGIFWHGGAGPDPYGAGSMDPALTDISGNDPALRAPSPGQAWLRIPHQAPHSWHKRSAAWRPSCYGGLETMLPVRGWHRTTADAIMGPLVKYDWKNGNRQIMYLGICRDGLMRNGINDSHHRGVWFYLSFLHPWAPVREIVVELWVRQSATHKSGKHLMKYCAAPDTDTPGDVNPYVDIAAIHFPQECVPQRYLRQHS